MIRKLLGVTRMGHAAQVEKGRSDDAELLRILLSAQHMPCTSK